MEEARLLVRDVLIIAVMYIWFKIAGDYLEKSRFFR